MQVDRVAQLPGHLMGNPEVSACFAASFGMWRLHDDEVDCYMGLIPCGLLGDNRRVVWFHIDKADRPIRPSDVKDGRKLFDELGKEYRLFAAVHNERDSAFARAYGFKVSDIEGVLWR